MSLSEIVDDDLTDKNTTHSYLNLYEELLCDKKETATDILEIGIGDFKEKNGGSVKMWRQYFESAHIYSLDILGEDRVIDELKSDPRITLYTSTDAYDSEVVNNLFVERKIKFDMILDDGPHTLESMKVFIQLYLPLLKDDGILIIEDVKSLEWIKILEDVVPDHLRKFIKTYDLRDNKDRYDDIVFTVDMRYVGNDIAFFISGHQNLKATDFCFKTVRKYYPTEKIFLFENGSTDLFSLKNKYNLIYHHCPENLMKYGPKCKNWNYIHNQKDLGIFLIQLKYTCIHSEAKWILMLEPDVVIRKIIEYFPTQNAGAGCLLHKFNRFNKNTLDLINQFRIKPISIGSDKNIYGCAGGSLLNREKLLASLDINYIPAKIFELPFKTSIQYQDALISYLLICNDNNLEDWRELVEPKYCKDQYRNTFAAVVHPFKYFYNKNK